METWLVSATLAAPNFDSALRSLTRDCYHAVHKTNSTEFSSKLIHVLESNLRFGLKWVKSLNLCLLPYRSELLRSPPPLCQRRNLHEHRARRVPLRLSTGILWQDLSDRWGVQTRWTFYHVQYFLFLLHSSGTTRLKFIKLRRLQERIKIVAAM